jgi:DNA-binding NarL/FixJ family response regulator
VRPDRPVQLIRADAICERLFRSPKTVETHVGSIFAKPGLLPAADDHRRVLAVLMYIRSA